jgi:hypothetical protein
MVTGKYSPSKAPPRTFIYVADREIYDKCPNLVSAINGANQTIWYGENCKKALKGCSNNAGVWLKSGLNPLCWGPFEAWAFRDVFGWNIIMCSKVCNSASKMAGLLLHEHAHTCCGHGIWTEPLANQIQDECAKDLPILPN